MASGTITTVVNMLIVAVSYPLYLHFLGYEKYGVWLVLTTVISFAQLADLGIGPAVMKLVAEEHGRSNPMGIRHYVSAALLLLCSSGVLVLATLLIMKEPIVAVFKLNDRNSLMVLWLLPYIGGLSIYVLVVQMFGSVLSGLGRMDLTNYAQTLGGVVQVVVSGSLLVMGFDVKGLLLGSIGSYLVIHVITLMQIRRIEPLKLMRKESISIGHCFHLLRFGKSLFMGSLISMLLNPFNRVIVARYAGVAAVPVYEIAFTGCMRVRALFEVGLRSIVPEISRISADMSAHAKNSIAMMHRRSLRLILLSGVPLYAVLFLLAPVLLKVWLRGRFAGATPMAFRVMLIGTFLSLVGVPAYYTLLGLGRVRHNLGSLALQAIVNAMSVLMVLALSKASVNSIVCCTSLAMGASTIYLLLQYRRAVGQVGLLPGRVDEKLDASLKQSEPLPAALQR